MLCTSLYKKVFYSFCSTAVNVLAVTLYQGHPDRNHKLWNIASTERYAIFKQLGGENASSPEE